MARTRREFLTVALGAAAAPFLPRLSLARAFARSPRRDRTLVLVDLAGGNDGLNTVVPFGMDRYHEARPTLRFKKEQLLALDEVVGLRGELSGLRPAWEKGQLAIVQGVGYPRPDRSHFRSTDIWHTGSLEPEKTGTGWIGRLCEHAEIAAAGRIPSLMVGDGAVPLLLAGERATAPQVLDPDRLRIPTGPEDGGLEARSGAMRELAERAQRDRPAASPLDFLRDATRATHESSARIEEVARSGRAAADYPASPLGSSFKLAARLLTGGLDCTAWYLRQPGYDTHAFQAEAHAFLLKDLGDALGAFWQDVEAAGAAGRVVVIVSSEFGRRVQENGSRGTDHGAAAPVLVLGGAVQGGLEGRHPSLEPGDLEDGDVRYSTDFRRIHSTLLSEWLEVEPRDVLGESFERLPLFATA